MNSSYDVQSYERLIRQKVTGKTLWYRAALIFAYLFWLSLWFVLIVRVGVNAPMIAFILLSTVLLVVITWKYTFLEYEYVFADGGLYLTKIYGKKKRKAMLEVDLSTALLIAPYDNAHVAEAERMSPTTIVRALSAPDAADVWMLMFDVDKDQRILVLLETDERMLRIFRHYNPRVTARQKLSRPTDTK